MRVLATKPDLTAQAHEAIRDAIVGWDLEPGAPLAQEDLAERLGVSRQPISHALVLLRREGLVVDRGRKGQMVAPIDADRLLSLYQVRGALDRLAVRLATERIDAVPNAAEILNDRIEDGKRACADGGMEVLVQADLAFHRALHDLSGNAEISKTADSFWPHMVRSMRLVLLDPDGRRTVWDEHRAIVEAMLAGKVDMASALAAGHAERAGEVTYHHLTLRDTA